MTNSRVRNCDCGTKNQSISVSRYTMILSCSFCLNFLVQSGHQKLLSQKTVTAWCKAGASKGSIFYTVRYRLDLYPDISSRTFLPNQRAYMSPFSSFERLTRAFSLSQKGLHTPPFCTADAYSTPSFHIHSRNFPFWNPTQPLSIPLPLLFFLGLFPIEQCSIVSLKSMRKMLYEINC